MKSCLVFMLIWLGYPTYAQESKGALVNIEAELLSFEELITSAPAFDSLSKSTQLQEEEQLKEELKNKGLDNLSELQYIEKGPVKYYIVLKAFSNLSMAKKYIEIMGAKGFGTLRTLSEEKIHRVYHAVAYSPEEANKLKEQAKLLETEAWIFEQPY